MFSTPLFVVNGTLCKIRLGGSFCFLEGGFRGSWRSTSKVLPSDASARTMPFSTEVTLASMYACAGSLTQHSPPTSLEDHWVEWFILDIVAFLPAFLGRGVFGFGLVARARRWALLARALEGCASFGVGSARPVRQIISARFSAAARRVTAGCAALVSSARPLALSCVARAVSFQPSLDVAQRVAHAAARRSGCDRWQECFRGVL
jgi:hypothetical protein